MYFPLGKNTLILSTTNKKLVVNFVIIIFFQPCNVIIIIRQLFRSCRIADGSQLCRDKRKAVISLEPSSERTLQHDVEDTLVFSFLFSFGKLEMYFFQINLSDVVDIKYNSNCGTQPRLH